MRKQQEIGHPSHGLPIASHMYLVWVQARMACWYNQVFRANGFNGVKSLNRYPCYFIFYHHLEPSLYHVWWAG